MQERQRGALVVTPNPLPVPDPDSRWLPEVQDAWARYWTSEVAPFLLGVDHPSISRLFSYYDMWCRVYGDWMRFLDAYDVPGEALTGGHLKTIKDLEGMIVKLEERCGITPLVRARLGIKVGQAIQTGAKLNEFKRKRRGES